MTPRDHPALGMGVMALAMLLLPMGDAITKALTAVAPPFEVTVWRATAQALWFVPVALVLRRRLGGPLVTRAAVLSGACLIGVSFCLISAFQHMPIATAIAIFFLEPLLLTLLAGPLLSEVPGPRRLAAVGVGLVGALVVIRPNFAVYGPVTLMPVLAALLYALNVVVMRSATRRQSALSLQIGAAACAAVLGLVALAGAWAMGRAPASLMHAPDWAQFAIIGAGALAAVTFLMITQAFSLAEASMLAPLQYLEIVGATVIGWIVFGDLPDGWTWVGTAIILSAGLYIWHRERRA
ncbi:MAG: DMT family transporter [Paracoccus sp. (in: a-proteobacteria)]|uniref:DMT family transporter n=1 Tax=Paracoccus sp. TaxID=267 RepID=UPI004058F61A